MHEYKQDFFDFVDRSAGRSAIPFVQRFAADWQPRSVLDVGCGRGVWLTAWSSLGVGDFVGVDGGYVESARLKIPSAKFTARDIGSPFDLGREFDLVTCLEVAEHLPENRADDLVDNLTRHGRAILFSAAVPGQGGEFHVNEQPLQYWRTKFTNRGYETFDYPRPHLRHDTRIEPWYRFNALLYVHRDAVRHLCEGVTRFRIPVDQSVPEMANFAWRLRCRIIRTLPRRIVHRLAMVKHRLVS